MSWLVYPQWNRLEYPLNGKLGWPQRQFRSFEEENPLPLLGIKPLIIQHIA
jgi:hypothetical protein